MKLESFVTGILLATSSVAFADGVGVPVESKFATYSGPAFDRVSELKGTVLWVAGSDLFVAPDAGYQNLLITGNKIKPQPGEYVASELPNLDTIWQPLIKLETYSVGGYVGVDTPFPPLVHDSSGGSRPIQQGDHIAVTGQYAIDYAHTMYAPTSQTDSCSGSFSYSRGPTGPVTHTASFIPMTTTPSCCYRRRRRPAVWSPRRTHWERPSTPTTTPRPTLGTSGMASPAPWSPTPCSRAAPTTST